MKLRTALGAVALITAVALIAGCGGSTDGTTGIRLLLADDPLNATAVNVTISEVAVSKDGVGWTVLKDYGASPAIVNLLDYRYDGDPATPDTYLLADTPLDAGHYTQIRLILTKVELVDTDGNVFECEMSSQDKTGLKLIGEFDVAAGQKSAVLIDFNVAKSIVREGNGTYKLKPTVRVVPVQITGSLHGVVQFTDADAQSVAVPVGATITAYQADVAVASALIAEDGTFGMNGLIAGAYTLKLETEGFTAADTPATVVASEDADVGTIAATPTPP